MDTEVAPSPEAVVWAAERTMQMHEPPRVEFGLRGRCKQCTDGSCPQLAWAEQVLGSLSAVTRSGE